MPAVLATFFVAEGQAEAFEAVMRSLVEKVRAHEPGVRLYTLVRSKTDANLFKMMELYATKADLKAHGATPYFQDAVAAFKPLLAAETVIEVLDEIV